MFMNLGQIRAQLNAFRVKLTKMSGDELLDCKIHVDGLKGPAKGEKDLRYGQRQLLNEALRRQFGAEFMGKVQERRDFLADAGAGKRN